MNLHKGTSGHLGIGWICFVEHFLQGFQHCDTIGEHSIRQQKRVEKVDTEESQVCQTLKQAFRCSRTNLRHLARVQGSTESDIHVVVVQFGIVPDGLRHADGAGVRQ